MRFVTDPPIALKIRKMKERVRWKDSLVAERQIDQTRLVIDDGKDENPEFSFLVIGDSGSGAHRGHNPQRRIAEGLLQHREDCRFVLHTGDVIYLVGSSEYYYKNFIDPYREFLVGSDRAKDIPYDRMVFNFPFLPVPGNHDYYDLPIAFGALAQAALPLRQLFKARLDLDIGWHGSQQGKAYAKAFIDYLLAINTRSELVQHFDRHYTAKTETGYCLRYQPKQFTRLPNRYYRFRYGGIDFFALDSNTFNAPMPIATDLQGADFRRMIDQRRAEIDREKAEILIESAKLNPNIPAEAERIDDLKAKLEQLEEIKIDLEKQLDSNQNLVVDWEQLEWLRKGLVESWNTEGVRGRVIFFHHPPYVTEATKWHQAQTLAVRLRLRKVFNAVAEEIGSLANDRSVVDLVLNGHAHCLEYLRSGDTGHADSNINWIVCGGSGYSLRRQRQEGPELTETFPDEGNLMRQVATSQLFIGRNGHGSQRRRPYSYLRIDVQGGNHPKYIIRPFVSERYQQQWIDYPIDPFIVD